MLQLDLAMEDGEGHHGGPGDGEDGGQVVSLSPPCQSTLMLRRRALYNSQPAAMLRTCAPLVEESMMNQTVESPCWMNSNFVPSFQLIVTIFNERR